MEQLVDVASKVSTPLALAGVVVCIFSMLSHRILQSKKADVGVLRILLRSIFVLSVVALLLGFAGFALPIWYQSLPSSTAVESGTSVAEEQVRRVKDQVVAVRADYESLNRYTSFSASVHQRSLHLGEEMSHIPDAELNPAHRILQQEYGCYALFMAASTMADRTTPERTKRIALADRAVTLCRNALRKIQEAEFRMDELEYRYALNFARDNQTADRCRYLLAASLSIKGRTEGRSELKQEVQQILRDVSPAFSERVPPHKTQDLSWVFEKRGK